MMKVNIIVMLCCILSLEAVAQNTRQNKHAKEQKVPMNWHFLSLDQDDVYGAEINKAYKYLKKKKKKKKIIVAIIDSGTDCEHEDLKNVLWVNENEIPNNGIDDDQNGYVDDIHGWNFLGTKDSNIKICPLEADREYMRLMNKYQDVDSLKVKKKDRKEYEYFTKTVIPNARIGKAYQSYSAMKQIVAYADVFTREMEAKFPGEKFTINHFNKIAPPKSEKERMKKIAFTYWAMYFGFAKRNNVFLWEDLMKKRTEALEMTLTDYQKAKDSYTDNRKLINDDITNIKDRYYGNNKLSAETSDHGTHVAGIVGAERNNKIGINGVADVKLMIIRAVPKGDEYDKDVALAIRYAVENGANIINMSFGKPISPQKKWVDSAMKLARKKGVLLVHGAGNNFMCTDNHVFYPVKHVSKRKDLDNFINVGSIAADGNPAKTSNYGQKEVEIFAQGVNIYSSVSQNNYKKLSGTSMAAPVVSGVAALIWTYFPELSVQELRQVLLQGVSFRNGDMVDKPQSPKLVTPAKKTDFKNLCETGGILNAYQSVKLAEKIMSFKK